ncbi:MAG: exonuclease domain-containing protein [Casimicrobiaceae bacterium]
MRPARSYWIWLAALYGGTVATVGVFALLPAVGVEDTQRRAYFSTLRDAAPAIAYAAGIAFFLCAGLLRWVFGRYPRAARQLADQTRVLLAANPEHKLVSAGAPEIGELAAAINDLADRYRGLAHDLETKRADARERIEEERNRFAALMSELSEGVLVCNADGRILLYNVRAANLLGGTKRDTARGSYAPLGLGRSVFALFDRDQIAHALDNIHQQLERGVERPRTRSVTAAATGLLLRVEVAPYLDAERKVAGMVFTLDDVGGLLGREGQRLKLLQGLATGLRAPAANLRAAVESLAAFPDMEPARRAQFIEIATAESRVLAERLDGALSAYAEALKGSLTLEDMRVIDLLLAVQQHLVETLGMPTVVEETDEDRWVRVDSFGFVQAIASLASRLRADYGIRDLRLRAGASGRFAEFDLVWTGAIVASDALGLWENEPMRVGADETPLTLKDVLERHGGEVWSQADRPRNTAWFRFLLPLGEPVATLANPPAAIDSRPEYYDFDLFQRIDTTGALAERRLGELSYTVFDTETTGLEPSAGDEIISIGAVRIVNGRLLKSEVFERLVDPRRPISREATRIHGLDRRALAGEPPIGQVLPGFHRFCEDTVLVAHNAAFDMRFLELKEAVTGVRFAQPVLDTLLLSAVVHSSFEDHDLDTIAERLGVRVIGRHTALGDALLTGEVFLRLLPLLAGQGIVTLGQALEASRETYHARLQY